MAQAGATKKIIKQDKEQVMIPGQVFLASDPIICNKDRQTIKITVKNTGDRPIQVGSHTHFFEVNRALEFPREKAFGFRLNIPSGTAARFEPGDSREIELCELGGRKLSFGFSALTMGSLSSPNVKRQALEKARRFGFKGA
jgi:urease subunit beta